MPGHETLTALSGMGRDGLEPPRSDGPHGENRAALPHQQGPTPATHSGQLVGDNLREWALLSHSILELPARKEG